MSAKWSTPHSWKSGNMKNESLNPGQNWKISEYTRDEDDWMVRIGADLELSDKAQLKNLIEWYKDIFTWPPMDMPGIEINMLCHKLSINKGVKPIQ